MDSSISPKYEIWFLPVCHHIANAFHVVTDVAGHHRSHLQGSSSAFFMDRSKTGSSPPWRLEMSHICTSFPVRFNWVGWLIGAFLVCYNSPFSYLLYALWIMCGGWNEGMWDRRGIRMFNFCLMKPLIARTKSIASSSRMIMNNGLGRLWKEVAVAVACLPNIILEEQREVSKCAVKITGILFCVWTEELPHSKHICLSSWGGRHYMSWHCGL